MPVDDEKKGEDGPAEENKEAVSTQAPVKLGQFTLKAFKNEAISGGTEESSCAGGGAASSQTVTGEDYLPLVIVRNKGACYSNSLYP